MPQEDMLTSTCAVIAYASYSYVLEPTEVQRNWLPAYKIYRLCLTNTMSIALT